MSRDVEQFLSERGDGEEVEEWFQEMKWDTKKSYKFGDSGTDEFDMWLPKSLVTVRKIEGGYEVKGPRWLFEERMKGRE